MGPRRAQALSRDRVLDAALELADSEGLAGLSMRRLATRLGVEAMSLYNHVASKGDLLDGLASRVFESIPLPDPALPWDDRLRLLTAGAHAALGAHPVVVRALVAEQANPRSFGSLRVLDAMLGALLDAGLSPEDAVRRYRGLLGLVFGSVLVDSTDPALATDERDEPVTAWFTRTVTAEALPSLHRALPALVSAGCRTEFSHELDLLIDGLRATTSTTPGRRRHDP
ncbi:Regulatory protein [Frankia sp. AiPs1]|uniref:TetR family transcriptional regulator n=1 Tax=Frankia sp. AiPa1 TaxID=573492 RepID=UPI00202B39C2|nr:TetR/AcrR family transcriptional regulator C-terminal domain-containing protein [Frankia sp. AiPa1]MCL9762869.1 TetR/AcrR family transcriptional regulator C-terminal domain-containing protein [Frankia sp. AiPa1]